MEPILVDSSWVLNLLSHSRNSCVFCFLIFSVQNGRRLLTNRVSGESWSRFLTEAEMSVLELSFLRSRILFSLGALSSSYSAVSKLV